MKKIATISILAAMLAGCMPECKTDEKGRPIAVQKQTEKTSSATEKNTYYLEVNHLPVILKYVMFDGHEYIIAKGDKGLGITHSPRCECRK